MTKRGARATRVGFANISGQRMPSAEPLPENRSPSASSLAADDTLLLVARQRTPDDGFRTADSGL